MESNSSKQFSSIRQQLEDITEAKVREQLKNYTYDANTAQEQSNKIAEAIVKECQVIAGKLFKLQCIAMVLNRDTTGFHLSASCYWDANNDGNVNKKFDFETCYVIITMFGTARV